MKTADLAWIKSSYSDASGGNCIEVAAHPTTIHLRDSKNPNGPRFAVTPATWAAFVSYAAEES
ncbi:DUF397 domain-containing protein [Streptomyces exfoliatus]|uniref:DUF397 domain-containing protein n=1 Tax=Streptomyces exfoliatus TaxID=1905 RepID=UPI000464A73B|nr:DUF397 domain-containing protein [Streptomyces exfoliatus]